jgi:hypothetical protein
MRTVTTSPTPASRQRACSVEGGDVALGELSTIPFYRSLDDTRGEIGLKECAHMRAGRKFRLSLT